MQTSHVDNTNTHAVIGGGQAVAFQTAQTAEFFEILSSTLYSDKPLAFAREVICNAWDSHIVSGKSKIPVEVTVNEQEITIRDFGKGIPDNKMAEIYCVYGNSTKENDGLQTGGFGLGSKAPFAYTKNFAVTSFNEGTKSLYNISRGTTATNGVPDMRKIISVPTTEQGLMVSVPTGQAKDVSLFIQLFQDLCRIGGILVKINGKLQRPLEYPTDIPFVIMLKTELPAHLGNTAIEYYVKYGSVLYPLVLDKISPRAKIRVVGTRGNEGFQLPVHSNEVVILVAPPHSIGVTPSRESLSYTPKTIDTITELLAKGNQFIKTLLPKVQKHMVQAYNDIFTDGKRQTLEDYLKGYEKSEAGYDMFVSYAKIQAIHHRNSDLVYTLPSVTVDHLVQIVAKTALDKGTLTYLVSDHFQNADPKGIELRKRIKAVVRRRYPVENDYAFKMMRHKLPIEKIMGMGSVILSKRIYQEFKPIDAREDCTLILRHRRYASEESQLEELLKYTYPPDYRYHSSSILDMIKEQMVKGEHLPVIVSPSLASCNRAVKREKDKPNKGFFANVDAWVEVIVYNKASYERIVRYFTIKKKRKFMDTRESGKIAPRPVITDPKLYVLAFDDIGGRIVKKSENLVLTHYMPTPGRYMVPDRTSPHEITAKVHLTDDQLNMIVYLFPNVVLSSTTEESRYLEEIGLVNIFKTIADESKAFFEDKNNVEVIMENMSTFSSHFKNYTLSKLLGIMTPTLILEGLGREPKSYGKAKVMPSVCHLFASMMGRDLPPKYGVQYCHKVAKNLASTFGSLFDMDMELFNDPDLSNFLGSLPTYSSKEFKNHPSIYQTAALSAMQHARVQVALSKMRVKKP